MLHVSKSVTINRPRDEVYQFWRELENLPRFMHAPGVGDDDRRPAARTGSPRRRPARTVEWDAEIVEDRAGRADRLALARRQRRRRTRARCASRDAPADRGTEVRVELQYDAPGGSAGATDREDVRRRAEPAVARRPAPVQAGDGNRRSGAVRRQPRGRRAGRVASSGRRRRRRSGGAIMKATCWMGKKTVEVRRRARPADPESARRHRPHHLDRDLRLRPAPLQRLHADDEEGRHPRPRVHGRGDGGRPRRQEPQGRRPRRRAVHHRLRQLLALPARHVVAVRELEPQRRAGRER